MTRETDYWYGTVAEYRVKTPECTGELLDAMDEILADDDTITVRGDEYCVGDYDGNQTWLPLN